jgi:hypothetical protein
MESSIRPGAPDPRRFPVSALQMDLTASVARALARPNVLQTHVVAAGKPVFQLCAFPLALDLQTYADPHSGSNPNGSLTSLFAFRELVDPVPTLTHTYSPSPLSTESVYASVLGGAAGDDDFARQLVAASQQSLRASSFSNLDGTPGSWGPIYSTPPDWYDLSQRARFVNVRLDLTPGSAASGPFAVITDQSSEAPMTWLVGGNDQPVTSVSLDAGTTLDSVELQCLEVRLSRPWLNYELLGNRGWHLPGQPAGYCSTGRLRDNGGVLPLLPTSCVLALNTRVSGSFAAADQSLISGSVAKGESVALGPFMLHDGQGSADVPIIEADALTSGQQTMYVVGWISSLVPLSPTLALPARRPAHPRPRHA